MPANSTSRSFIANFKVKLNLRNEADEIKPMEYGKAEIEG